MMSLEWLNNNCAGACIPAAYRPVVPSCDKHIRRSEPCQRDTADRRIGAGELAEPGPLLQLPSPHAIIPPCGIGDHAVVVVAERNGGNSFVVVSQHASVRMKAHGYRRADADL